MTLGELIIAILVILVFFLGIYGGLRLFRWNQRDREAMAQRNKERMNKPSDTAK